jgi:hypothetical protein
VIDRTLFHTMIRVLLTRCSVLSFALLHVFCCARGIA